MFRKEKLVFDQVTTRGGDRGDSFIYSGEKKIKSDLVFEVLGDLDELNSYLGIVRNLDLRHDHIPKIQEKILNLSSQIATTPCSEHYKAIKKISEQDVSRIESWQKGLMSMVEILPKFILPGEKNLKSAHIDFSRTLCRRSERHLVGLIREQSRKDLYPCQIYLNRLSDYLFILARYEENFN